MRYLLVLLIAGCASAKPLVGNTCVEDGYEIGKEIRNLQTGKIGKVTKLHGRSEFCQVQQFPILADVEYR